MKTVSIVVKVLTALAAVAGVIFVIATYGDKIVAWAKKLLSSCRCKDGCCEEEAKAECECADGECECECACACEAAEEAPVEEAVHAEEADFEA